MGGAEVAEGGGVGVVELAVGVDGRVEEGGSLAPGPGLGGEHVGRHELPHPLHIQGLEWNSQTMQMPTNSIYEAKDERCHSADDR